MFIAHIPAGFLLSHALVHRRHVPGTSTYGKLMLLGMLASILPDSDFIYRYLFDAQRHFHHSYWTHIPLFWLGAYAITAIVLMIKQSRHGLLAAQVFYLNTLLHCVLDSTAGGILWLYPWDTHYYRLAHLRFHYAGWQSNFFWHWTFLLELLIVAFAILQAWRLRHYFVLRQHAR